MREIKFRVWDNNKKCFTQDMNQRCGYEETCLMDVINDTDYEVMQYTGLKDKNGKEIYEGDITEQGIITFSRGKFTGTYYDSNGNLEEHWEDDLYQRPNIEVIGNVYENPGLLNK